MPFVPLRLSELLPNWIPVNGGLGPTPPVRGRCPVGTEEVEMCGMEAGDLPNRRLRPPPGVFWFLFHVEKELAQ